MGRGNSDRQDSSWANWFGTTDAAFGAAAGSVTSSAQIQETIRRALWLLECGIRTDSELALLTGLTSTQSGRRRLVAILQPMLLTAVREVWGRGWEPIDLARYVGKRLTAGQRRLAIDLTALQLQEYAAAVVPPSWPGQLRELQATVWWPRDEPLLTVWAKRNGWASLLKDALAVLHLIDNLVPIEQLGPLPGERQHPESDNAQGEVDPRILSRVRHLLAQAESTNFEAEAESFTAAAQSLMARHQIDRAMIEAAQRASEGSAGARGLVRAQRVGIENPYEGPKALLLNEVALANRCRMVWNKDYGYGTVVGHAADRAAVEVLFTSLLIQATRAMTTAGSRSRRDGGSRTRSFRSSFLTAFATRIGERLEFASKDAETTAAESAGGGALVPVLAARKAAVDAAVDEIFPELQSKALGSISDGEGWRAGMSAADRAELGAATPLNADHQASGR